MTRPLLTDTSEGRALSRVIDLETDEWAASSPTTGGARRLYKAIGIWLAVADGLCLIAALLLAWVLRFGVSPLPFEYVLVVWSGPVIWVAIFRGFGLHACEHLFPPEEIRRTLGATAIGLISVMIASFWFQSQFSRSWLAFTFVIVLVLEIIVRRIFRGQQARLRREGRLVYRTLIVGCGKEAARLSRSLATAGSGFAPLGYVSTGGARSQNGLPVLGSISDLAMAIRRYGVDCIFVASTQASDAVMIEVARAARREGVEVKISANLPEILASRLCVQPIGGSMAISVRPVRLNGLQSVLKLGFDLVVGSLFLAAALPGMILIAIAIKATSRGPVFFRQVRVSKGGRPFTMFKFRTMVGRADLLLKEGSVDFSEPFFKLRDDPRLTKVGRVLRRYSLDELPQFLNVLRGEMSLVGPRPLPVEQVNVNSQLYDSPRHEVRAGITGWWQINGRSELDATQALKLDLFYIENWSLTLDLYILAKTFVAALSGRGAF